MIFFHTVSAEFGHRTVKPFASARTSHPARVCGVTSDGLLLVFIVSIKFSFFTSQVPVRWYVFVRSVWLNHDSSRKAAIGSDGICQHRILNDALILRGRSSSSRNQVPARLWRKSASNLAILTCRQCNDKHAAAIMIMEKLKIMNLFMVRIFGEHSFNRHRAVQICIFIFSAKHQPRPCLQPLKLASSSNH